MCVPPLPQKREGSLAKKGKFLQFILSLFCEIKMWRSDSKAGRKRLDIPVVLFIFQIAPLIKDVARVRYPLPAGNG